jgi:hypothetical protein
MDGKIWTRRFLPSLQHHKVDHVRRSMWRHSTNALWGSLLWTIRYVNFAPLIASVSHHFIAQAIDVIECPEFWDLLLLLRSNLQDAMIPRWTKVRQIILEAWSKSFEQLKHDLSVSLLS